MKALRLSMAFLIGSFVFVTQTKAQKMANSSYYVGNWDILAKGIPEGDTHLFFTLADSSGTIKGTFLDPDSKSNIPLTRTELNDSVLTVYFTARSYDVYVTFIRKDQDSVTGSLMGMFDTIGARIKTKP